MQEGSLEEAISLYKTGNKKSASIVLKNLVRQEPTNEAAWLWLSACLEKNEQKEYCLNKVLEINPGNRDAKTALQMLTGAALPEVGQISEKPKEAQRRTISKQPLPQPAQRLKKKKARNLLVAFLAVLGFVVLLFSCMIVYGNYRLSHPQVSSSTRQPKTQQPATQPPTQVLPLVVQAGTLSQYESQITKDTVINVYKKDGTLDERQGDIKELCLDWLYYRAKIQEYESAGENEKANEARASFDKINLWLDEYNEADVETMFSIIENNNWSNW